MTNFVHKGKTLTVTAPYDVSSGGGVLITPVFGIASKYAKRGATDLEIDVVGVFDITKADPITFAFGAAVYWDDTNKNVTSISSGNTKIGVAVAAAASGDATARVRLNGIF